MTQRQARRAHQPYCDLLRSFFTLLVGAKAHMTRHAQQLLQSNCPVAVQISGARRLSWKPLLQGGRSAVPRPSRTLAVAKFDPNLASTT